MAAIIKVKDINKSYQRDNFEVPVLNNISLDVEEGEFLALMGP